MGSGTYRGRGTDMAGGDTTTYVEPYVKSDGTRVKGHYRHVHPGEGERSTSSQGTAGGRGGQVGAQGTSSQPTQSASPSQASEWSSLPSQWREGAGRPEVPGGGIDGNSLSCSVQGDQTSLTVSVPSHLTVEEVSVRLSDPQTQEMLVATYKRGQVSRTDNQRKWLAAEMSRDERENLARDYDESVICSNKVVYMSRHLKKKIEDGELSVPQDVVEETLRTFADSFVEYSLTTMRNGQQSRRVLLRNNNITRRVRVKGQEQDANLCIVLDIDTCCMVTAYWNAANDQHDTLNRSRYEHASRGRGAGKGHGQGGGGRDRHGDGRSDRRDGDRNGSDGREGQGKQGRQGDSQRHCDYRGGKGGRHGRKGGRRR